MGTRRKVLAGLGAVCLVAAAAAFYYYRKFTGPSHLPEHIPNSAETVIYINAKVAYRRFFAEKDTAVKFRRFKSNPYLSSIENIRETGIDLLSDAAYVKHKGITYILVLLDDARQFQSTLGDMPDGLFGKVQEAKGFKKVISLRDSFIVAWKRDKCVFIPKTNKQVSDAYIGEILSVKEKESFGRDKQYALAKNDDALVWFFTRKTDLRIAEPSALKGYLNFDSSVTVFASTNLEETYSTETFSNHGVPLNFIHADTGNSFVNKTLKAISLIYLPDHTRNIDSVSFNAYSKTFSIIGKEGIRNEIISYEYDENFNKKTIVTVKTDTINAALMEFTGLNRERRYFSNSNSNALIFTPQLPASTKLFARFNQELLNTLYPVAFKYEVQLQHTFVKGYDHFLLRIDSDDWDKLLAL
jgi:hypothetical protein